jgi:two-component system chemotaxis response regulator CheB
MAFDIVGIGCSSGGISALETLLGSLPSTFGPAILVVQHLYPSCRSHLPAILDRRSALPVCEAVDGDPIRPGTVVTAPAACHLTVDHARIAVTHTAPVRFSRPSVDVLLESIAADYGAHAIGVILTGCGSDGANGMRAIKARGGTTIVQDPAGAQQSGMPAAAWATQCIDFRLPLADIGPALAQLVANSRAAS